MEKIGSENEETQEEKSKLEHGTGRKSKSKKIENN